MSCLNSLLTSIKHFSSYSGQTCCEVAGPSLQQAEDHVLQSAQHWADGRLCCTELGTALPRGSPAFAKALQSTWNWKSAQHFTGWPWSQTSCTECVGAQLLLSWLWGVLLNMHFWTRVWCQCVHVPFTSSFKSSQERKDKVAEIAVWKQKKKNWTFLSLLGKCTKRTAGSTLSAIPETASCSCFCVLLLPQQPGRTRKGDAEQGCPCWPCRLQSPAAQRGAPRHCCGAGCSGAFGDKSQKLKWNIENTPSLRGNRRTSVTRQITKLGICLLCVIVVLDFLNRKTTKINDLHHLTVGYTGFLKRAAVFKT